MPSNVRDCSARGRLARTEHRANPRKQHCHGAIDEAATPVLLAGWPQ